MCAIIVTQSSGCFLHHPIYAASIGTTTGDLEWPWMAVSRIACYRCSSCASGFYIVWDCMLLLNMVLW